MRTNVRRGFRGARWAVATWLLSACHGAPPAVTHFRVTHDTVGGIPVVRDEGLPPEGRLVPVTTVPASDSGLTAFGRIVSVVLGTHGSIYVADGIQNAIIELDSAGHLVRTIGRKGHGPAEFESLYSLAWLGDTLVAYDPGNARIGVMGQDGAWLGEWRTPPYTGNVRLHQLGPHTAALPTVVADRAHHSLTRVAVMATSAGIEWDMLLMPRDTTHGHTGMECDGADGGLHFHDFDLSGKPLYTFAMGPRIVRAWSGAYRLAYLFSSGDTTKVVERSEPPPPLSDSTWDAWLAEFHKWREGIQGATCHPSGDPDRPAHLPALREIFSTFNGDLWIDAAVTGGFAFDVFTHDDSLSAEYRSPEHRDPSVVPYVRGRRLALVTKDSHGVQAVHVYRLEPRMP